jgi:hypothetical protein
MVEKTQWKSPYVYIYRHTHTHVHTNSGKFATILLFQISDMHPVPSSSTPHHVRGIICFGPDVSNHGFVLCKKHLVGLRSVSVVYKLPLASIPKRCGT